MYFSHWKNAIYLKKNLVALILNTELLLYNKQTIQIQGHRDRGLWHRPRARDCARRHASLPLPDEHRRRQSASLLRYDAPPALQGRANLREQRGAGPARDLRRARRG